MQKTSLPHLALFAALALTVAGCATAFPFLSPEDRALREKVEASIAQYTHVVNVSVVNARVYLTSATCVDTYGVFMKLEEAISQVDGVKAVFNDVPVCGNERDDWGSS